MPDDSAEKRTARFTVKPGGGITPRRSSGQRGTRRDKKEGKSDVVKAREQAGKAATQVEIREVSRGDGEGLPSDWGDFVGIRGTYEVKSPGYDVPMTRTGEPTQEPTLSGQALEEAQREARRERARIHFGRGRRYGK